MTVLITRPAVDAPETAEKIQRHGIETLINPMMAIKWATNASADINTFDHIIFTSKNGIRSFCQFSKKRDLTAWCVGDETTKFALESGFKTAFSAKGTSSNLYQLIQDKVVPQPMLRIMRLDQKDHFSESLNQSGYIITQLPLYCATPLNNFTKETTSALTKGQITDILFYSPYTARITVENIQKAGISDACCNITAWCISNKTSVALDPLSFKEVIIADEPNENALLKPLIKRKTKNG